MIKTVIGDIGYTFKKDNDRELILLDARICVSNVNTSLLEIPETVLFDGIEYKAIKTDVPEDIDKIFNINSNNIQQQFDNIFWFSETAGEVGRNLNSIVNLDIID